MNLPHDEPRAHLDHRCQHCGQVIVHLDIADYFAGGGTPEAFATMVDTLVDAHRPDCKPRRTKPSPANRRRRGWWWFGKISPAILWALIATTTLLSDPDTDTATRVMRAVTYVILVAVFVMLTAELLATYRRGYTRGRLTVGQDRVIDKNLHPADGYQPDYMLGILTHHHQVAPDNDGEGERDQS